jgi:hypothetical protein
MICWQDYMKYHFAEIDDSIIIMTKQDKNIQFRPPIGPPDMEIDKQVLGLAKAQGSNPPFGLVNLEVKERMETAFPKLVFEPDQNFFDYVYLSTDLAELSGKKYLKIRYLLNRFNKRYEYTAEPINKKNIAETVEFLERWCLWKDCDKIPLLSAEKDAVLNSMKYFFELELSGLVIRIDGEIESAAIFESLTSDTAVVHFEKPITDFEGLYQVINQETAKSLVGQYQYINRESDMGFPGLRTAKKKYQPNHMVEVFHVNQENLEI